MDWQLYYLSGVVVTAIIGIFTLIRAEDITDKIELGLILFFGLLVWPILLYGLIVINTQIALFKAED